MEIHTTFLPKLKIKKLIPEAHLPTKGSEQAAGYDLYSSE
jgi:dUTPase